MIELTFTQFVLIFIVLVNFSVGIYVLLKNPKQVVNRTFFIFVCGAAVWIAGIVLLFWLKNFTFDKVIHYGGLVMIIGFFLFAQVFPTGSLLLKKQYWLLYIPFLFAAFIIIPSNLIITGMIISPEGTPLPINGPLLPYYALGWGFYFFLGIFFLGRNYFKSLGRTRLQIKYFFIGIGFFFTSTFVFDLLLPSFNISYLNLLGPLSSLVFIGFTAYAIVRHQLMDIRVIVQRGLIYSVLVTLVLIFYIVILNVIWFVFQQQTEVTAFLSAAITTLIAVFSVPIIERFLRKITDKIFFKDKYNYSEALHELSEVLNKNIKLKDILYNISKTLKSILRTETVTLLLIPQNILFDEKENFQKIEKFYSDKLIEERIKHPDSIVHNNIPYMLEQDTLTDEWKEALKEIRRIGEKNKVAVSVPIVLEHKLVGFLALGKKLSGDLYTSEDMRLLETFSYQAAVAIEKAKLYEEVKDYSKKLEKKVKERTREIEKLQQTQKQMMVDISHGLQTPLTTIKNELSFLKKQIPSDKKISVFEKSIDDVSLFIYDLLRLARLEAGEEKFEKESMSFSKMLHDQIEYFKVIAEHKHIVLDSSIEEGITIIGDKKKLEELTVNLVSNAIKYMKQKGKCKIYIGLVSDSNVVKLTIVDNGIGISKKDIPHIFERFNRAKNLNNVDIKGTGLGLAICKKIVEQHNGTITAKSKLEEGTTFIVTLPTLSKSDTR